MEEMTMQGPDDERDASSVSTVSDTSNISNVSNVPVVEIEVFEFESQAAWPCQPW